MKTMNIFNLIIIALIFSNCQKNDNVITNGQEDENVDSSIYKTWVLISKEKITSEKSIKQYPTLIDTAYPIILSFIDSNRVCGYHDANQYDANYIVNENNLSFSNLSSTDVADTEWYLNYLSYLHDMSFSINNDTLMICNDADSLTMYFLSKEAFNTSYFNVDSLYSYFFTHYNSDTSNFKNQLHGSSWVLIYIEKTVPGNKAKELQPTNDSYPIILSIYENDSIYGRHDANIYYGNIEIYGNDISISNMFVTDVSDNNWYLSYVDNLTEINKISNHVPDSIKFYNEDSSLTLNYISKELFNNTYYNIDSIY